MLHLYKLSCKENPLSQILVWGTPPPNFSGSIPPGSKTAFEKSETKHNCKGCVRTQSIDHIFGEKWLLGSFHWSEAIEEEAFLWPLLSDFLNWSIACYDN